MKKVLAFLVALGFIFSTASGVIAASDIPVPSDYDKIPTEHLPLPVY
ncbi:hypothetical protein KQ51_01669 [Candidatus Izimaplasma bacterium HR1]|jgi:hypothetical protein|nr:hypothetical protein KQ51_01669 [Candidatus Izimaplasma bacterium HR1]